MILWYFLIFPGYNRANTEMGISGLVPEITDLNPRDRWSIYPWTLIYSCVIYRWREIQRDHLQHNRNNKGESPESVPLSDPCSDSVKSPSGWYGLPFYRRTSTLVGSVTRDLSEQGKNNQAVDQAAGIGGQKMRQHSLFSVYLYLVLNVSTASAFNGQNRMIVVHIG